MKKAKSKKVKETPAEQHARFVETARKVEASEDPAEFEKAFKKIIKSSAPHSRQSAKKSPA